MAYMLAQQIEAQPRLFPILGHLAEENTRPIAATVFASVSGRGRSWEKVKGTMNYAIL